MLGEYGSRRIPTNEPKLMSIAEISAALPSLPFGPWQAEQLFMLYQRCPSAAFPFGLLQPPSSNAAPAALHTSGIANLPKRFLMMLFSYGATGKRDWLKNHIQDTLPRYSAESTQADVDPTGMSVTLYQ